MKFPSSVYSSTTLMLLIVLVSLMAGYFLVEHDRISLIYFGDAVSHLVRTRQITDSLEPGLLNLGTVWLPLPHLILLPAAAIDHLFYSGIAGAVIGIPLLAGTCALLFSILFTLTNSRPASFIVALLFGLNPNIVYIALTPMNELSLLFFVTLGAYALQRWLHSEKDQWMILCSAAVLCATLCRYEAWILDPFISMIALSHGIVRWREGRKSAAFTMVLAVMICSSGILFWFGWNWIVYDDPLKFLHWTYSVGTDAVRIALNENPLDILVLFGKAILWIFGPMMIVSGFFIFLFLKKIPPWKRTAPLLLFLVLPLIFNLAAVFAGYVQMDEWWWNWRFVLTAGLFLSAASALVLSEFMVRFKSVVVNTVMIVLFVAIPIVQLTVPSIGTVLFKDAKKSFNDQSRSTVSVGEEIGTRYESGTVSLLTGYGYGQRIMISSRLPLKTFIIHYFPSDSLPNVSGRYMIVGKERGSESVEFSTYWTLNKVKITSSYTIVSESNSFVLLQHR